MSCKESLLDWWVRDCRHQQVHVYDRRTSGPGISLYTVEKYIAAVQIKGIFMFDIQVQLTKLQYSSSSNNLNLIAVDNAALPRDLSYNSSHSNLMTLNDGHGPPVLHAFLSSSLSFLCRCFRCRFRWCFLWRFSLWGSRRSGFGLGSLWLGHLCLWCFTRRTSHRSSLGPILRGSQLWWRWASCSCCLFALQLSFLCLQQLLPLPLQLLKLLLCHLPHHRIAEDFVLAGLLCLWGGGCLNVLNLWLSELLLTLRYGCLRDVFLGFSCICILFQGLLFVCKGKDC